MNVASSPSLSLSLPVKKRISLNYVNIQGVSKGSLQTLRGEHHKDSELHRNPLFIYFLIHFISIHLVFFFFLNHSSII